LALPTFPDGYNNDPAYYGVTLDEVLTIKDSNGVRINNTSLWDDASTRSTREAFKAEWRGQHHCRRGAPAHKGGL